MFRITTCTSSRCLASPWAALAVPNVHLDCRVHSTSGCNLVKFSEAFCWGRRISFLESRTLDCSLLQGTLGLQLVSGSFPGSFQVGVSIFSAINPLIVLWKIYDTMAARGCLYVPQFSSFVMLTFDVLSLSAKVIRVLSFDLSKAFWSRRGAATSKPLFDAFQLLEGMFKMPLKIIK